MKKSCFFTALVLLPLILLAGCADHVCPDHVEEHGRDLTVKLQVEYTVPADAEIIEDNTFMVIEYAYNRDLIKIAANSDVIVRGTVEKVANTSVGNAEHRFPYSAINLKIDECLKGDLGKDDQITIFQTGSYMPLSDYIKYCGNSEREIKELIYSYSEEEIEKKYYHIIPTDEAPAEAGEECIYFLTRKGDDSLLSGAYRLTRGAASVLHCRHDGTLIRYPSDSVLDPANDNIEYEKFTTDSVMMAISRSENYVPQEKYQAEGS